MRAQLRYDGCRVCVRSRPGRDCTAEFPELAAIAEALDGRRVILDGELVCLVSTPGHSHGPPVGIVAHRVDYPPRDRRGSRSDRPRRSRCLPQLALNG